jgi:hypothetical protein
VFVRVRPVIALETDQALAVTRGREENSVVVQHKDQDPKEYQFDRVLWQHETQDTVRLTYCPVLARFILFMLRFQQVYSVVGQPILESALRGINGTIFAYGQTGSGKTHTLLNMGGDVASTGLLPRMFRQTESLYLG